MKTKSKIAVIIGMAFGLAIAGGSVLAHWGSQGAMQGTGHAMMGTGMGAHASGAQMGCHGMGRGAMHGAMMHGAMMHGADAKPSEGSAAGMQSLFTAQERAAMHEQMHTAQTQEERQAIAAAHRAEMHKRATERGITLPERHGPRMGRGMGPGAPATAPETSSQ
jgi:hypothetical protein